MKFSCLIYRIVFNNNNNTCNTRDNNNNKYKMKTFNNKTHSSIRHYLNPVCIQVSSVKIKKKRNKKLERISSNFLTDCALHRAKHINRV